MALALPHTIITAAVTLLRNEASANHRTPRAHPSHAHTQTRASPHPCA